MRIYNGKKSQVDLPLSGGVRIAIGPGSVSRDIMPSEEFLSLLATSYDETELALIVGGPYEVNMCAHIPAVAPLIVQSLDAAIQRFQGPAPEKTEVKKVIIPVEEAPVPAEEEKGDVAVEEEEIVPAVAEDPFEKEFPDAEFPETEEEAKPIEEEAAPEEENVQQPKGKKKNNKKKK